MKVLNTKSDKFKTHKFKKYNTYKKCTKCNIVVHHMGSGVWVEDLQQGTVDFVNMMMSDTSMITGKPFKNIIE